MLRKQANLQDCGQGYGWGRQAVLSEGSLGAGGAAAQQVALCQGHRRRSLAVQTRGSTEERRSRGPVRTWHSGHLGPGIRLQWQATANGLRFRPGGWFCLNCRHRVDKDCIGT